MNMKKNNDEFEAIWKGIKQCFNELELPVIKETIEEENVGILETQIDTESFSMYVEAIYRPANRTMETKITFSHTLTAKDQVAEYLLINFMNVKLMDIGHFALIPPEGDLILQTSLLISGHDFDSDQVSMSLLRIIYQGLDCFNLQLRMADTDGCPLKELTDGVQELLDRQPKEIKPNH